MKIARWLLLAAAVPLVAGCGSSHRYTVSQVRHAFRRVGFHHPRVQSGPPGVIFNYGKPPHVVSVTVYKETIPVVFQQAKGMRVTHLGNVMVYYSVTKRRLVQRALNSLK